MSTTKALAALSCFVLSAHTLQATATCKKKTLQNDWQATTKHPRAFVKDGDSVDPTAASHSLLKQL